MALCTTFGAFTTPFLFLLWIKLRINYSSLWL
nr:MAG TPA: hypothetical protein [Caudoviricetes sp.]